MKSAGILRYSPKLLGDRESDKWWLILDCDEELGRYYRHLYRLSTHRTHELTRPSWKEHVTIIRDEEPADQYKLLWERYAGYRIYFEYQHEVRNNESYYWLDVRSTFLLDLREELGLSRHPEYSLHLTIGNDVTAMHKNSD